MKWTVLAGIVATGHRTGPRSQRACDPDIKAVDAAMSKSKSDTDMAKAQDRALKGK